MLRHPSSKDQTQGASAATQHVAALKDWMAHKRDQGWWFLYTKKHTRSGPEMMVQKTWNARFMVILIDLLIILEFVATFLSAKMIQRLHGCLQHSRSTRFRYQIPNAAETQLHFAIGISQPSKGIRYKS